MTSTVLVVGATGSVGRHVVPESLRRGHLTRALVRQRSDGQSLPADADVVVGDLSDATTLAEAVDGVDAVAFPHGSHGGAADAEAVDYGAVRNVLLALGSRRVRIALMTAIGVTKHTPGNDWDRRGVRLVRAMGSAHDRATWLVRPPAVIRPA